MRILKEESAMTEHMVSFNQLNHIQIVKRSPHFIIQRDLFIETIQERHPVYKKKNRYAVVRDFVEKSMFRKGKLYGTVIL